MNHDTFCIKCVVAKMRGSSITEGVKSYSVTNELRERIARCVLATISYGGSMISKLAARFLELEEKMRAYENSWLVYARNVLAKGDKK